MKNYFTTKLLLINSTSQHLPIIKQYLQQEESSLKSANITKHPSIAIYNQQAEGLKIETVRNIIQELAYSSYQGKKRWCILMYANQASIPAQNALLKVIEEPPKNTQLILTCSGTTNLLPTIISRCQVLTTSQLPQTDQPITDLEKTAKDILDKLINQQLSYYQATHLAKKYKDRDTALILTTEMLQNLNQAIDNQEQASSQLVDIGQTLLDTRNALQQNLNARLVLEHLFFTVIKSS